MPTTQEATEAAASMLDGAYMNVIETDQIIKDHPDLPEIVVMSLTMQAHALVTLSKLNAQHVAGLADLKDQSKAILDKLDRMED